MSGVLLGVLVFVALYIVLALMGAIFTQSPMWIYFPRPGRPIPNGWLRGAFPRAFCRLVGHDWENWNREPGFQVPEARTDQDYWERWCHRCATAREQRWDLQKGPVYRSEHTIWPGFHRESGVVAFRSGPSDEESQEA